VGGPSGYGDPFKRKISMEYQMKKLLALASILLSISSPLTARAESGGLVTTLISNGTRAFTGVIAPVVSGSQKVIAAGDIIGSSKDELAILNYTSSGALNTSFSSDGYAEASYSTIQDLGTSVIVESDGQLVVGGYGVGAFNKKELVYDYYFSLTRWTASGALSFGVTTSFTPPVKNGPSQPVLVQTLEQPVGSVNRLLSVGNDQYNRGYVLMARYSEVNGSLDTSFGSGGLVSSNLDVNPSGAILYNGNILIVGNNNAGEGVLAAFKANGSPNTALFGNGSAVLNLGIAGATLNAISMDSNGNIVLSGALSSSGSIDLLVARVAPGAVWALDSSFNGVGYNSVSFSGDSFANSLIVNSDNSIVISGYEEIPLTTNRDVVAAKFLSSGALDASGFGSSGTISYAMSSGTISGNAIGLQANGDFVIFGQASVSSGPWELAMLRYTSAGVLDSSWNGSEVIPAAVTKAKK
jgi:uncharacterized delta-60 repeat protein